MTECGSLYHFHYTSIVSGQKLCADNERGTNFYENSSSHEKKTSLNFRRLLESQTSLSGVCELTKRLKFRLVKGEEVDFRQP